MKKKAIFFAVAMTMGLFLFTGCSKKESGGKTGTLELKLANELSLEHTGNIIYRYFADKVKEYSNGSITVTIYPNGTLGSTKEVLEQAQEGTIDFAHSGGAYLENFAPEYAVFGFPYIFDNKEHFSRVMSGDFGKKFQNEIPEKLGLHGILYLYAGTRSFYVDKPINSIDDLAGLKVRVQPSNIAIEMASALGVSPTPMAYAEVYSALQQGVLDGAENNPTSYISARHYEVAKYYVFDEHQSVPDFLLMNEAKWNSLTSEQQDIIAKAALEAQEKAFVDWDAQQEEAIQKAKKAGSVFTYPDKTPYKERVAKMIDERRNADPTIAELLSLIDQARE